MNGARRAATFDDVEYAPGRRFKVVRPGLKLTGYVTDGPGGSRGWDQPLSPGDVITCTGYGAGFGGDPGYGIEFTSDASVAARAFHCDIWPMAGSVFDYRPPAGALTPEEVTP